MEYGRKLAACVKEYRPDSILSANTPIDIQARLHYASRTVGAKFIFWVQDIYGIAIQRILSSKYGFLGAKIGDYYRWLEIRTILRSTKVILITKDFLPYLDPHLERVDQEQIIPNWAPIEDLPIGTKENRWACDQGLSNTKNLIYSGTLGLKHNPEILLKLARRFQDDDNVRVIVISEGLGAEWLKDRKSELQLDNLILLPFQPYELFPLVLATADVLVAILEPDAGVFSVPSKILSYMCAGKPILINMPLENMAARVIIDNDMGRVSSPGDLDGFIHTAGDLLSDPELCETLGGNARAYAEKNFSIGTIADQFEEMIRDLE
ncbi:MAG: glycosyltransferase family 4 protein [Deltaproteobacteria bacterium]|nr:glycosyltransferase family 4 protein [Deltaproteobacteria bacterium]